MATVTIQEAQANLVELIRNLVPGDEVVITDNNRPVAKLVGEQPKPASRLRPPPGLGKGLLTVVSDDEDHLQDFKEYMP
jgi:prevent-host-death family protein